MKTKRSLFNSAIAVFLFSFTLTLFSQPQHYNANSGGIGNSIPFAQVNGYKTQHLIAAGEYNQPAPAPAGNITKFYIYMSSTGGPATYTQLLIKMGQTSITTFPSGEYTGQLDTVYYRASVPLSSTASTWLSFTLDRPYNYNPAQSLVIQISHCGYSGTGMSVWQTAGTTGIIRRNNIPGTTSCVFTYSSQDTRILQSGIDIAPAAPLPDLLYYKFERNPNPNTVINCGTPGVGTPTGPISGTTLGSGGQFDSCLVGTGATSSGVTTGWNTNFGSGSWTISFWTDLPTTTFGYLFGDGTGSFRCFNNGAAGTNGITLRGTGITNVDLTGFGSGPVVVHFVYDSAMAQIRAYKNGVLSATIAQTPLNLAVGAGFRVGGYTTVAGYTGKLDEFRVYRRALTAAEITATWNTDIGDCNTVGISSNNSSLPTKYALEQNFPNPFNPVTTINYSVPKSGLAELKVFDVLGREITVLASGFIHAGYYTAMFDASSLSSGVYFYTFTSGEFTSTKKMLLVK